MRSPITVSLSKTPGYLFAVTLSTFSIFIRLNFVKLTPHRLPLGEGAITREAISCVALCASAHSDLWGDKGSRAIAVWAIVHRLVACNSAGCRPLRKEGSGHRSSDLVHELRLSFDQLGKGRTVVSEVELHIAQCSVRNGFAEKLVRITGPLVDFLESFGQLLGGDFIGVDGFDELVGSQTFEALDGVVFGDLEKPDVEHCNAHLPVLSAVLKADISELVAVLQSCFEGVRVSVVYLHGIRAAFLETSRDECGKVVGPLAENMLVAKPASVSGESDSQVGETVGVVERAGTVSTSRSEVALSANEIWSTYDATLLSCSCSSSAWLKFGSAIFESMLEW